MNKKELLKIKKIEQQIDSRLFIICAFLTINTIIMISSEFFSRGIFPSP